METMLMWVGAAFGALVAVAVVVTWVEHLLRTARPPLPPEPAPPAAVRVDVRLDALEPTPPATPEDMAARRAALDGTLDRAARAGEGQRAGWIETRPMVLQSARPPGDAKQAAAAPSTHG